MYLLVVYDISDNRVREKVKRLLWRYGLSPIARSTYIGKLGSGERTHLAEVISRIIGKNDIVILVPVQNIDIQHTIFIQKGEVWTKLRERGIIVIGKE